MKVTGKKGWQFSIWQPLARPYFPSGHDKAPVINLFTSHCLSLSLIMFSMTVLRWQIATKHVRNNVCQHIPSEIRPPFKMERYVNNRLKQNTLLKGTLGDQSISKLVNHRPFSHDSVTFSSLSGSTLTQASMHTFMNTRMSSIELYNVLCI